MHTVRARGGERGRALAAPPVPAGDESRVPGFSARPSPGAIRARPVSGARPPTTPALRLHS
eukprot:4250777-Prymnesium_polylepis.1